jgi:hypothetical protein
MYRDWEFEGLKWCWDFFPLRIKTVEYNFGIEANLSRTSGGCTETNFFFNLNQINKITIKFSGLNLH